MLQILDICNTPECTDLLLNIMADEDTYIGRESAFYRALKANTHLGKRTSYCQMWCMEIMQ
ncbi:hypothetical protein ACEZDF_12740 [Vibrio alginolyticus]|uniref:hypothetical protein n=1 Tax=Vibrio alginolyticus TaxID=663 RepID=UPI0035BF48F6